ncbi:MAG TPA: hypothetical protein VEJ20_04700 [Candidatus Eremiobacteraceae bacterium]|nr:hypothetical protein [Candidatus Eremiobacteraceae bacterium]
MDLSQFTTPVFVAKIVDFVILVAGLTYLWQRFGKAQLIAAQIAQNKAMDDAVARKAEAEASIGTSQAALEQARVSATRMVELAGQQARNSVERERTAATELAERIVAHAQGELERERYRVRRELLEDTVERAHAKARELAEQELDTAKQQALIDRVLADLGRVHG